MNVGARTYLVGQMLAAIFAGGWRPNNEEERTKAVEEAVKTADVAMDRMNNIQPPR